MKVAELEGASLDYWTARAAGVPADGVVIAPVEEVGSEMCCRLMNRHLCERFGFEHSQPDWWVVFSPSSDWLGGGPVIDRVDELHRLYGDRGWSARIWLDPDTRLVSAYGKGPTPLVAACRALIASVYGEEVPA